MYVSHVITKYIWTKRIHKYPPSS